MGTLVRVLMFPRAESRIRIVDGLRGLAERGEVVYNRVDTIIVKDDIESVIYDDGIKGDFTRYIKLRIPLKLRVSRGDAALAGSKVLENEHFRIEVEIPEEVETLRGEWRVKRRVTAYFFYYRDKELEDVAVLASSDGVRAISGAVDALGRINLGLPDTRIEFPVGQRFREMLRELGMLGWISISEIRDVNIRFAIMGGRRLEEHPIVSDFSGRGRVTAVIIVKEDMRLVLSNKGIYVQQGLSEVAVAERVAEIVKVLKRFGTFRFG